MKFIALLARVVEDYVIVYGLVIVPYEILSKSRHQQNSTSWNMACFRGNEGKHLHFQNLDG